ncbi:MAG: DUF3572 domain-containing protein [Hyphomicrobium sp.]|uniref:DUF3572 domain-containing protein n=1 Tax=Hyphomicrobium sp. TaxID=82 RepID=UPI003568E7FB
MPRLRPDRLSLDDAETIALQALGFLADDPQRVSRFLSLTGSDAGQLRAEAKNREFQAATLEYMLGDESLLLAFCQEAGIDPVAIGPAYALLGGQA